MKKLLVVLVLVGVAAGAFADEPFASWNEKGDVNVYASVGFWGGVDAVVGAEFILGEFDLGPVPCDWGVMASAGIEWWYGMYFGVGALATFHLGLTWNLDFSLAAGVTAYNNLTSFPVTWAHDAIARYWFSEKMAAFVREGYLGFHFWGVGLEFKL